MSRRSTEMKALFFTMTTMLWMINYSGIFSSAKKACEVKSM